MTNSRTDPTAPNPARPSPPKTRLRALWDRASLPIQLALSLAVAGGALAYLLYGGRERSRTGGRQTCAAPESAVQVAGPRLIRIQPGTALDKELQVTTAKTAWLTSPILPVTGTVLASLRPGKEASQDAWQFATSDLLTAFSDWQKAGRDIQFQETQLKAVRDLNESKIDAQKKVVARMEKLVAAGTDTAKDLAVEQTNLIQYEIQARKDIHDQEQNVYLARRTEATLRANFSRRAWNQPCFALLPPRGIS